MRAVALVVMSLSMIGSARGGDAGDVIRRPVQIPPQEPRLALRPPGEAEGLYMVGRATQATATAEAPSDAQLLEYFRQVGAMSREEYKQLAKTLPFTNSGTVRFPAVEGSERRLSLGRHRQYAVIDGIVVSRVFDFNWTNAESKLEVHNGNSFPVFVEIDYLKTAPGDGVYAALAPGETAFWSWPATICVTRGIVFGVLPANCNDYAIRSGTAHVRTLKLRRSGPA